ncbi:RDD family protein [Albibacterium sp.]|uniref:RDD family protein n=1 Tax=Albibacterium sp. TaxID=2952885 RepID=UPI002B815C01|nr:RDD family protein [Albibacterium sp.]HUH17734.1 RDD family protein [Albibacterium sp.]
MSNRKYFYVKEGKPEGPFSLEELKSFNLKSSDFVKEVGSDDFHEIHELSELSKLLSLKHEITIPQYFATMDIRLLAWAIDFFFAFALYCIGILLPILAFTTGSTRTMYVLIGLLAIFPIQFISSVFLEASKYQGTIGKLILRIKVCNTKGLPIGFARSLWRNICKILGFFSLGIGFFAGFFSRKQQCWHDKLADTLVVKDRLT